jgi:hypothetical protein
MAEFDATGYVDISGGSWFTVVVAAVVTVVVPGFFVLYCIPLTAKVVNVNLTTDGGLLKKILKEGVGEATPEAGMNVTAHYTGTLDDGTKFDSSRDRGK